MVGMKGRVYAVEISYRSGRGLIKTIEWHNNIASIFEDARHPHRYPAFVPVVDVIFADLARPDQTHIVGLNAQVYLKVGGGVVVCVNAVGTDDTVSPGVVYAGEQEKLREEKIKPTGWVTLGMILHVCCSFELPANLDLRQSHPRRAPHDREEGLGAPLSLRRYRDACRFMATPIDTLQEAAEQYVVRRFEGSGQRATMHAKRTTVQDRDNEAPPPLLPAKKGKKTNSGKGRKPNNTLDERIQIPDDPAESESDDENNEMPPENEETEHQNENVAEA
ncbi:MAG: Small subunit processome complex component [Phylliscum demangeonii]|nr:MAG: Small subunit processome complex component [Phylliscum demangeonii]